MNHIFISYSSKDYGFASRLADSLERAKFPVWMDKRGGIEVGGNWVHALENGVDQSIALILALSPNYAHSVYCRRELHRAEAGQKPILPLLLQDVPQPELPIELQTTQYLDFREWNIEKIFSERLQRLILTLQKVFLKGMVTPDSDASSGTLSHLTRQALSEDDDLEETRQTVEDLRTQLEQLASRGSRDDSRDNLWSIGMKSLLTAAPVGLAGAWLWTKLSQDLHGQLHIEQNNVIVNIMSHDTMHDHHMQADLHHPDDTGAWHEDVHHGDTSTLDHDTAYDHHVPYDDHDFTSGLHDEHGDSNSNHFTGEDHHQPADDHHDITLGLHDAQDDSSSDHFIGGDHLQPAGDHLHDFTSDLHDVHNDLSPDYLSGMDHHLNTEDDTRNLYGFFPDDDDDMSDDDL